jgi:transcriptional regulator with XRE-family HTH domain
MSGEEQVLGAWLRTLRERALFSQEELATRSGLSVGTIAGIEAGRVRRRGWRR